MPDAVICEGCGAQVAPALLSCPSCHRLMHAGRLNELAKAAKDADRAGDRPAALAAWREAMELLPPDSQQYADVARRVAAMTRELDAAGIVPPPPKPKPEAAAASSKKGAWAAVIAILVAVLSKGKFLLAGLGKAGTFWTMLLSIGVYWTAWGWRFALGLVLSIYVHEMGHVAMLRRYGMKATAPMFVPGLGALIRLKQRPADAREDAMIGLAGPTWGLAAAATAWATGMLADAPIFLAIGKVGAWLNLFNLTPFGPLDGGRGFRALSTAQRWLCTLGVAAAYWYTGEGLLLLVLIVAAVRAFGDQADPNGDANVCLRYLTLVAALTALARTVVEMP